MPAFESLSQQRRSEANAARRQSISDQTARGGIFTQFFHKYASTTLIFTETLC